MNRDYLYELLDTNANLTDAGILCSRTPSNLRFWCKRYGMDWTKILNKGKGVDLSRDREHRDGFEFLTDWQRYRYRKQCNENRIGTGTTKNPSIKDNRADIWHAQLNLEGDRK